MNVPTLTDRFVKMGAYITDEHFGYDHWQARQFCSPADAKPAVLVVFETKEDRDRYFAQLQTLPLPAPEPEDR